LAASGQNLGLELALPIPGDLHFHLTQAFHGELARIGAIAMIDLSPAALIPFPSQMNGQLPFHQGGKVFSGQSPEIQPHHFKELFRSEANLLENFKDLGYIDFQLHGVSPSWCVLANSQSRGNTPFFIPLKFHTILFTLPRFNAEDII